MKKILILMLPILFQFYLVSNVFAVTPIPTDTITQDQVTDLKNKIASKVAELKLVEKRGIIGTVTDSSDTQITLKDFKGNTKFVDVDELTKFSSTTKSFGISDVTKNMTLGVLGLYNKQSRRILAREVTEMSVFPNIIYAGVIGIDKNNFEITVVKENGQQIVLEIEDITKTYTFAAKVLTKSGFSKIETGQAIVAVGLPDKQDANKIITSRLLILPEINISDSLKQLINANPTIPPSTGSGVKLFPIKTN